MSDATLTCATHRDDLAGWRCDDRTCRKLLCGKCTAKVVNQPYCGVCGATASQLVIARHTKSFPAWLAKAVLYPVRTGILLVAVMALLIALVTFTLSRVESSPGALDVWSGLLRGAIVFVFALIVADSAARGDLAERGAPARLGRAVAATACVWLPAVIYMWCLGVPAKGIGSDKSLWAFAGLALIYLPIAIATAVTDASAGDVVNPFKLFELAWQLGRRYWTTVLAVAVLGVAAFAVTKATTGQIRHVVSAPVVSDLAAAVPMLVTVAVLAYVIGLLAYVHGDRLGWADAPQYCDPIHPRLIAEGKRKNAPGRDANSAEAAEATAALAERNDARKISDAIKEENFARALKLYEMRVVWAVTSFDERQLLLLGKAAVRAKRGDLAKQLFADTIVRKGRNAGHALVALAQLHGQDGDTAKEAELYNQVLSEHPATEAAKVASLKLKP